VVHLDEQLLGLGDQLRAEGVAIGTSELLDAFAALGEVGIGARPCATRPGAPRRA